MSNAESSLTHTLTSPLVKRLPIRLLMGVLGAGLAYFTFPSFGIWGLMFPMLALIYLAARGLKFWSATLVGFVSGFTFFASQTSWLSMYLGPVPLIALSLLQGTIFAAFFGFGAAVITRAAKRLAGLPLALASAGIAATFWVAREWFSGNHPYGGFPWARLVSSQTETPLSRWVWLGGMPLADLLIVFVAVFALELLILRPTIKSLGIVAAAVTALYVVPIALPISAEPETGELTIASAQGNANAGLFSNRESGKILENHIAASRELLATGQPFDVMVWPENAVDLNLFGDPKNVQKIDSFAAELGKPLIFGTVTKRDKLYNSSILWLPGKGMTDWYDKLKPVPFAEYVPDRDFWNALAPDLVGLLSYDFSPGSRDGLFEVAGAKLGTLICFEIAVDEVPPSLVNGGAEAILSQTNNADFGKSDEAYQQLAIARLRAIETGRSLVNISTVGPSAVYLADGTEVESLPAFSRGFMNTTVPLRVTKTPAMFTVQPLSYAAVIIASILAIWLLSGSIVNRRRI